LAWAKVKQFF